VIESSIEPSSDVAPSALLVAIFNISGSRSNIWYELLGADSISILVIDPVPQPISAMRLPQGAAWLINFKKGEY
jgi:hypothetical protein